MLTYFEDFNPIISFVVLYESGRGLKSFFTHFSCCNCITLCIFCHFGCTNLSIKHKITTNNNKKMGATKLNIRY